MTQLMQKFKIATRVWAILVLSIVAMGALAILSFFTIRESLKDARTLSISFVLQSAHSVITYYHDLEKQNKLSREEAQSQASIALEKMRFDGGNYVYIITNDGDMLVNATFPRDKLGANFWALEDINGVRIIQELVEGVESKEQVEVLYSWPRVKGDEPTEKLGIARKFSDWQWVIGSGIYVDDLNAASFDKLKVLILEFLIIVAILIGVAVLVINSIKRPLERTTLAMKELATGDADLTKKIAVSGNDELSELANAFNAFSAQIGEIIKQTNCVVKQLIASSENLKETSKQTYSSIDTQSSETLGLATAMNEMVFTSQEVARHTEETAEATNEAELLTKQSHSVVDEIVLNISALAQEVDEISETIGKVVTSSNEIDTVLEVIKSIAEQTNLLALNAAIEAARAGEAGRGFAVVADEVRQLAKKTQDSTEEIYNIIKNLQTGSNEASQAMRRGVDKARKTTDSSGRADEALKAMNSSIIRIRGMSVQIATAAEEQSSTAEGVNKSTITINDATVIFKEAIAGIEETANSISSSTCDLNELICRFKV
ncbi:methyl-accepting chemotaxis protein [Agaribacter marinus]|uniref:Methyl-accepting chemotaxis protein n=1 Tax=Agaribacter marinus TaxID=1431249 RepID=A0AA37SXB5_9ALTE|nr:methyl-accepting chemotaxis protein [Agaribacter marinus]GLR69900.1 methyl-accepting chemotaxis protein [Agaribacter marinus]